jgi:16S rRNA (cytosine1402-N4)-methyltransferase
MNAPYTAHVPILVREVQQLLALAPEDIVFDGTVGGGGHMQVLLSRLGAQGRYIACDADESALKRVQKAVDDPRVTYCNGNFRNMADILAELSVSHVDAVLLDLGISSDQLTGTEHTGSGRGFSFQHDEPLAMTLEAHPGEQTLTAATVVNTWSEETLADVIFGFGEERYARRIAKAIVSHRKDASIDTTKQLADIVLQAVPRKGKTHPATKTFQALRIAVNDELGALQQGLDASLQALSVGGRIAVITFHSLEDRIVKRAFKEWQTRDMGEVLTKKPIAPSKEEIAENPRARSAKVRAFLKKHS